MARQTNSKQPRRGEKRLRTAPPEEESQGAEFLTVIWTLCVFLGALCDLAAALTRLALAPDQRMLGILAGLLFFAAVTLGIVSLGLLPLVLRARRVPPPRSFVIVAVLVAVAPLAALIVLIVR